MSDHKDLTLDTPLLKVDNLNATAGSRTLFEHVSFSLQKGERVAVTGPSGCGKTTLLRIITGLTRQSAGIILLDGKDGDAWGWPLYRRNVLLMAQTPTLLEMSVDENLRLPFTYKQNNKPYPGEMARELLGRLALDEAILTQAAKSLSVGQQQRVCLIRALLLQPCLICLDEPTSALDPDSVKSVQDILKEQSDHNGLAMLMVTHNREQANGFCHRTIDICDSLSSVSDSSSLAKGESGDASPNGGAS